MLNNIRKFASTKLAGVLVGIIIVPFVLWGMGGVFSGGNQNNIAKINNESISTEDFQDYLSASNIELKKIKQDIENNILEEILSKLISEKMLLMEVEDKDFSISDKILNKKIKEDKNFFDENNKFSRIKYEKFLLSSNISAPYFEAKLRQNELNNNLFKYIAGGLNTPLFLVNNHFKDQTKKITINYVNLSDSYKNREEFTNQDIKKFVDENKESLKEKIINFKYTKITPKNLVGIDEFNNLFFEKIDEIENEILNNSTFDSLINKYSLSSKKKQNFKLNDSNSSNEFYKKIYQNEETNKLTLLEENDFYVLYEITKSEKTLPQIENKEFNNKIKTIIYNNAKYKFNSDLIKKIGEKKFTQSDFEKISNNNMSNLIINSITDDEVLSMDSVRYIYSKSKNNFMLVADKEKNIYLAKITDISYKNISKNSDDFSLYQKQANEKITDTIYDTYDLYINEKYKVKINEKTLERVKNYFR